VAIKPRYTNADLACRQDLSKGMDRERVFKVYGSEHLVQMSKAHAIVSGVAALVTRLPHLRYIGASGG
jgi:hypothetical protein